MSRKSQIVTITSTTKLPYTPTAKTKAGEEESHLIHALAKSTRPSETQVLFEDRTHRVDDCIDEWQDQDVLVRERRLGQMRRDHLADTVGIDDSHVTDERDEV